MSEKLAMWTVYDHPRDCPEHFIARRFEIHAWHIEPTLEVVIGEDLETVRRALVALGLVRVARSTQDDPSIVETWL